MSDAARIGLGMMRIETLSPDEIRELYAGAREAGVTLFDHADIYGGGEHGCERRFGEALQLTPAERERDRAADEVRHQARQTRLRFLD